MATNNSGPIKTKHSNKMNHKGPIVSTKAHTNNPNHFNKNLSNTATKKS